jgi:hypothetical protein
MGGITDMNMQYSESFAIPVKSGNTGWVGGASALQAAVSGTAAITAGVRLWRDSGLTATATNPLTQISLRPGEIVPIKVRYVEHNSVITGFN